MQRKVDVPDHVDRGKSVELFEGWIDVYEPAVGEGDGCGLIAHFQRLRRSEDDIPRLCRERGLEQYRKRGGVQSGSWAFHTRSMENEYRPGAVKVEGGCIQSGGLKDQVGIGTEETDTSRRR